MTTKRKRKLCVLTCSLGWVDKGKYYSVNCFNALNTAKRFNYVRKIVRENGRVLQSIPAFQVSHLIISDDLPLLEDRLEKAIPTGLIIVRILVVMNKILFKVYSIMSRFMVDQILRDNFVMRFRKANLFFCWSIYHSYLIFYHLTRKLLSRYTGSTADLACEMLSKVESFLQKRRINPKARPDQPFKTSFPANYVI